MLRGWTVVIDAGGDIRTVEPLGDDVSIKQYPVGDEPNLFDTEIDSDIILVGEDFDWLRGVDQSGCVDVIVTFTKGAYSHTAKVDLKKLRFQDNRCTVALAYKSDSSIACLEETKTKDVNLLSSTPIPTTVVQMAAGDLETFSCPIQFAVSFFPSSPTSVDASCPPPAAGEAWTVINRTITNIVPDPGNPGFVLGDVTITYARQTATVPLGDGWIAVGGGLFVAPPLISVTQQDGSTDEGQVVYTASVFTNDDVIDNCLAFNDVVDYFVGLCGLTWRSVFFGKDAPAVADPLIYLPAVYDVAYIHLHNLLVAQKSDVKRAAAFQNATRARMNWEDVLSVFQFFNLQYTLQGTLLVVEHYSFFQGGTGIDLTAPPFSQYTKNNWYYEGRGDSLEGRRVFSFMDQTDEIFDGGDIVWDCGDQDKTEDRVMERFTTNVAEMLGDNPAIDDLGFALMAPLEYNGDLVLATTTNALFPAVAPVNGSLAIPNVQNWFHRHGGNYLDGEINETADVFESVKPQRETEASVVMCWEDYLNFDVALNPVTPYGEFRVAEATYSDKTGVLRLELEG